MSVMLQWIVVGLIFAFAIYRLGQMVYRSVRKNTSGDDSSVMCQCCSLSAECNKKKSHNDKKDCVDREKS